MPKRRFHIQFQVREFPAGKEVATKNFQFDEADFDGSLYNFELKRRELFRDLAVLCGHNYREFDKSLTPITPEERLARMEAEDAV